MAEVVKGAQQRHSSARDRPGRDMMIVRRMGVDDVELFPEYGFAQPPDVPNVGPRPAGGTLEERPSPTRRQKPLGQRAVAHKAKLHFQTRSHQGRGLVVDDGRRSGPFFTGNEIENAHENLAISSQLAAFSSRHEGSLSG